MSRRVLFVDDEPGIRVTLPMILERHGFTVVTSSTVPEALKIIQQQDFDVLLTDLNIGEPGDGFTLVTAMRRLQPSAVNLIITGFPAFETALRAIREQVDDYIVKPADIAKLVQQIEEKLLHPVPKTLRRSKPLAQLLRENVDAVVTEWLRQAKAHPQLAANGLPDG